MSVIAGTQALGQLSRIKPNLHLEQLCKHSGESLPPVSDPIPGVKGTSHSISLLSKNLKIKIHKTIIFPVVLYGYEAWSLTLREECRLRVFENRNLSRIFGPKRDENGEWRRLHNKELYSLYR